MLGSKYLVAPVVSKDNCKIVYSPNGFWKSETGKNVKGPAKIEIEVATDEFAGV